MSDIASEPPSTRARLLLISLTVLVVAIIGFHEIDDYDTWTNVKAGQVILDTGAIPDTDVFSHTVPENRWVYHEWLAAVVLEVTRRLAGIPGLVVFTALVAAVSFLLVLLASPPRAGTVLPCLLTLAGALCASGRFMSRPHMLTTLFFAIFLFLLEIHRRTGTRWILVLPLLQVVWTNSHAGFALGIVLTVLYLVGTVAVRSVKPLARHAEKGELLPGSMGRLLLVLGLQSLALLVNPYGFELALKPFRELGTERLGGGINEWAPPLDYTPFPPGVVLYYKIALVILGVAVLLVLVKPRPLPLLLLVTMGGLSWTARRHADVFALALVLGASVAFAPFVSWLRQARPPRLLRAVPVTVLVAALIVVAFDRVSGRCFRRDRIPTIFAAQACPLIQPVAAVDWLEETGVEGNLFNNYSVGGYLAYRLWPRHKVLIDGRNVMYGEFIEEYDRVLDDPERHFPEMETRYDIGTVFLRHASPGATALLPYISRRPGWSLAYLDQVAAIFKRGSHEEVRGEAVRDDRHAETYPLDRLALGQALAAMSRRKDASVEFEHALERPYPVPEAHLALSALYFGINNLDRAEEEAKKALAIRERWVEAHLLLAKILMIKRPPYLAEAEGHLVRVLEILPGNIEARVRYAMLLAASSEASRGETILREVVDENPHDPGLRFQLAQLLEGRQKRKEAREEYRKILEGEEEHWGAHYALGAMAFQDRDWYEALPHAQRAVELAPRDEKAKRLLEEVEKMIRRKAE
jgi:tetratricopeptide (TPR) repeat protein